MGGQPTKMIHNLGIRHIITYILVGGLEHFYFSIMFNYIQPYLTNKMFSKTGWWLGTFFIFPIILGMSSSQLTFTPSFFRGMAKNHQPGRKGCV